jgi:hypothetical protein
VPFTRPDEISNGVSLSDKLTGEMGTLVPEDRAADSALPTSVFESSPDKERVGFPGAEHDLFSGTAEKTAVSSVSIMASAIVSVIESTALFVAVFREPPQQLRRRGDGMLVAWLVGAQLHR